MVTECKWCEQLNPEHFPDECESRRCLDPSCGVLKAQEPHEEECYWHKYYGVEALKRKAAKE